MKKIDVSGSLDELLTLVREAQPLTRTVLLLKDGRAYAALTPVAPDRIEGVDDETLSVGLSPAFRAIIEEGRQQHAAGLTFSQEEMERLLEIGEQPEPRQVKLQPRGAFTVLGQQMPVAEGRLGRVALQAEAVA